MKTYIKFILLTFLKSFFYIALSLFSLVFIINLLTELDFFKEIEVSAGFIIYLSLINSPSIIFEMFPFIFLISTQLFFIKLFKNNEFQIFKYSGLKNSKILIITAIGSLIMSLMIVTLFYELSSKFKNIYLEIKSNYSTDSKYLAVITKNGLWIKDKINEKNLIINANQIQDYFLLDAIISEFDNDFKLIKSIKSSKININKTKWIIYDPKIIQNNYNSFENIIDYQTNFDYKKIQSLFSNLSSLSFLKLIELKKNYQLLNFSTTEINVQIQKIISYPFYLVMMTILSGILMLMTKNLKSFTLKIGIGFLLAVIIYYFNNFFNVLGTTQKISYISSVWMPLIVLTLINSLMILDINEK